MKLKKILAYTPGQLRQLFRRDFPQIAAAADAASAMADAVGTDTAATGEEPAQTERDAGGATGNSLRTIPERGISTGEYGSSELPQVSTFACGLIAARASDGKLPAGSGAAEDAGQKIDAHKRAAEERADEAFRVRLGQLTASRKGEAWEAVRRLIECDGREISELSSGERMRVLTLALLRRFLTGTLENPAMPTDLFIDLYFLFRRAMTESKLPPSPQRIRAFAARWAAGLDEQVAAVRAENKERMLHLLVQKIENRGQKTTSRFRFEPGMSYDDKYRCVVRWWEDFRFHLAMAVKSPGELNRFLGGSLSEETLYLLSKARKKGMPFFATPYYLSLLDTSGDAYDDLAVRSYVIYSPQLVETFGSIRAWEREDIVEQGKPNAAGWLLPNGHNIHRRYPEVAILIPDTMGRACGGLCASCQRMYDFQSRRLNFEFDALRPKETWEHKLRRLMDYFERDTQLRDILITGGDALMSQNKTLRHLLGAVCRMAERKRKANSQRPDGKKYAELQRVRLGTRLPAYLPMRVDDELVGILREFRQRASAVGVRQFIVQTHFQSPLEITPEAREAIRKILAAGWLVTNQLVFTAAASRRGHTVRLRRELNAIGVLCYYTFSVKGFEENYAMFTPNSRSLQEQYEEKAFGRLTEEQSDALCALVADGHDTAEKIRRFMRRSRLLFLATDRSVLNLPAIGKSMSFRLVGITAEGRRILRFDHDPTRRHSPIIDRMGEIFIMENKSLAAYLRQISSMGEDPDDYATLWGYTQGETEPRFGLYDYPDFPFVATPHISNLELE